MSRASKQDLVQPKEAVNTEEKINRLISELEKRSNTYCLELWRLKMQLKVDRTTLSHRHTGSRPTQCCHKGHRLWWTNPGRPAEEKMKDRLVKYRRLLGRYLGMKGSTRWRGNKAKNQQGCCPERHLHFVWGILNSSLPWWRICPVQLHFHANQTSIESRIFQEWWWTRQECCWTGSRTNMSLWAKRCHGRLWHHRAFQHRALRIRID